MSRKSDKQCRKFALQALLVQNRATSWTRAVTNETQEVRSLRWRAIFSTFWVGAPFGLIPDPIRPWLVRKCLQSSADCQFGAFVKKCQSAFGIFLRIYIRRNNFSMYIILLANLRGSGDTDIEMLLAGIAPLKTLACTTRGGNVIRVRTFNGRTGRNRTRGTSEIRARVYCVRTKSSLSFPRSAFILLYEVATSSLA